MPDIEHPDRDPVGPAEAPVHGGPDTTDVPYVYLPADRSRLRMVVYAVAGLAVALIVVGGFTGWWAVRQVNPSGGPGTAVTVVIPAGSSTSQIAKLLQDKGVVTSATVFEYYVRLTGAGPFKAGEYDALHLRDRMGSVVDRLTKGPLPPRTRALAIPEGMAVADIRARILAVFPEMKATDLDKAMRTVRSRYQPAGQAGQTALEGLLFPATYQILLTDVTDAQKLVQQMVTKFDEVGAAVGLDQAKARTGLSPYEVVVEASLIEREAKVAPDRPKIARVISNRLAARQRLEVDASLEYALGVKGRGLSAAELRTPSPFNLRQVAGLPPTPIASPGQASLEAALSPAPGPWLYYVLAAKDGTHYFTADYNDFLRAKSVAQAQGLLG